MSTTPRVDDDGIHLGENPDVSLDVLFGEQRVWSFNPVRDAAPVARHAFRVRWPRALSERLDGVTEVSLVPHAGGPPVFAGTVRFGTSDQPLHLVDDAGNPLSVDKGHRLQRTFDRMGDDARAQLVDAARRVLDDLVALCGLDAYLVYGCLLGAVRDGHMIGHDSDADLAWISAHTHPFDVIRESRAAERTLAQHGWEVQRMSAANFKVWVPLPTGKRAGVDVFGSFHVGERFHLTGSLVGDLPREAVLPLGTVDLEGVPFPAPRDVERFLAFSYGPGWRTPDPAFHFDHPRENVALMDGWVRGSRKRLAVWQGFWASAAADQVPTGPSDFARWCAPRLAGAARVVEIGAGNGRDAFYLAEEMGLDVTATDFCGSGLQRMRRRNDAAGEPLRVRAFNLEQTRNVLVRGAQMAQVDGAVHVYARLVLEAVGDGARDNLWRLSSMAGRRGGHTFLEWRTGQDGDGPRYNRVDPDQVVAEAGRYGGHVVAREEGRGLARHDGRDPVVCRMEVAWR